MDYLSTSPLKFHNNKDEILSYIKLNFGKISLREMARRLQIGKTTINKWSKELGFYTQIYTVNEKYFTIWNSEMAYILGYIFADGNISWNTDKSYRALTITTAAKDKEHMEKIRSILESTKPLLYSDSTNSYRLIVNNINICKDLMNLGVVPKKSLIKEFPNISDDYLSHFIRGYIDGNGTVRYVDRKRSPYFEIQICSGSYKFLEKLAESIESIINIKRDVKNIRKNVYLLRYTCYEGMQLANWVYNDQDLCLLRKFKQYKKAFNIKKIKGDN